MGEVSEIWHPWDTAPKDGRWIIACCWDGMSVRRVSWGRDRTNQLAWCSGEHSFGDGLFGGWIDCPQHGPKFKASPLTSHHNPGCHFDKGGR